MRIQHNILAMNAYRNYNTNTSALAKNLEKLSSGYKINRAGDDAAGLAISEKMRAQITGLNAAQKNVKDGVSLVKTAEGAMQEIQDMLNRMDYLATQSANGTYDNEVDRANLQKEVEQLQKEINRIADSANFNGIKLLDGSLDTSAAVTQEITKVVTEATNIVGTKDLLALPDKGSELSVNTVLHKEPATSEKGTTFSVDLHNTVFANNSGDEMTLKVGDNEWTLQGDTIGSGDVLKGTDLAEALVETIKNAGPVMFDGQEFEVEVGTGGDNRITFTQKNIPNKADNEVTGDMKVTITGTEGALGSAKATAGTSAVKAVYTIDLANADATTLAAGAQIDGVAVTWDSNLKTTLENFVTAYNGDTTKEYTASWDNDAGVLTLTAKNAGAVPAGASGTGPAAAPPVSGMGTMQTTDTVKAKYTLDLTGAGQANVDGKKIDGVEITWDTNGLNDTMAAFVADYNNATDNPDAEYTASWDSATNTLTLEAKNGGAIGSTTVENAPTAAPTSEVAFTPAGKAVYSMSVTGTGLADGDSFTVAGQTISVQDDGSGDITSTDAADASKLAAVIAAKVGTNVTGWTASSDGGNLLLTAATGGAVGGSGPAGAPTAPAVAGTSASKVTLGTITLDTAGTEASNAVADFVEDTAGSDGVVNPAGAVTVENPTAGVDGGNDLVVTGVADYNFQTTAIKNVTAEAGGRLASTYFDLTEEMVNDRGSFQIGKTQYTFSSDPADDGAANTVYIGDLVDDKGDLDVAGNLEEIAQRITDAAKGNSTWTVGHDKGGTTLSFVENQTQKDFTGDDALTSVENIAKTFGWSTDEETEAETETIREAGTGKDMNLQIGDTSDSWNQMKVSIGDMHTTAMGTGKTTLDGKEIMVTKTIEDVDIGSIEGAQEAIGIIKNAINYVSGVRGDLGATQNRLEHTANNLSVMAENIQDAESTIRDTDIAEEMMAYTKNNILIQSAQAMLAQANAVPQGVLQLLG